MRVLVTGASGYLASHLTPRLLASGRHVLAWGGPHWQPMSTDDHLQVAAVDLASVDGQLPEAQPVDAVIWLAQGRGHRQFPQSATDLSAVNLLGLTRVLDWARRAGAERFVYASTANVYAPSFESLTEESPVEASGFYAATKLAGEQLLRGYASFFSTQTLRIFGVYGPGQREMLVRQLIDRVTCGEPVVLQPAAQGVTDEGLRWTPCHAHDAAEAIVRLLDAPPDCDVINLAGSETVSIAGVARAIGGCLGIEPHFSVATESRRLDLVADNQRLRELMPDHHFITLAEALPEILGIPARLAAV